MSSNHVSSLKTSLVRNTKSPDRPSSDLALGIAGLTRTRRGLDEDSLDGLDQWIQGSPETKAPISEGVA